MATYLDEEERKRKLAELLTVPNMNPGGSLPPTYLADLANFTPPPMNSIRNESTGQVTQIQSAPNASREVMLDYSRPGIDVLGRKGYYAKGDPFSVYDQSGQLITRLGGPTQEEQYKQQLRNLEIQKAQNEVKPLSQKAYEESIGRGRAAAELSQMPGTPEYKKAQELAAKEEAARRAQETGMATKEARAQTVLDAVQEAKDKVGFFSTGMTGQVLRNLGGTEAMDLDKTINTIKANLGFEELQKMREASKTGGALGQVAVKELEFLQSAVSALDTAQSREQLMKNLQKVEKHYSNWQKATGKMSQTQQPSGSGFDAEKERRYQEWKRQQGLQ